MLVGERDALVAEHHTAGHGAEKGDLTCCGLVVYGYRQVPPPLGRPIKDLENSILGGGVCIS